MKKATAQTIRLGERRVDYRLITSPTARTLRVRVGPNGVEVLKPAARQPGDVATFLRSNETWVLNQLERADTLGRIRRTELGHPGKILFRGQPTKVRVESATGRKRENRVFILDGQIVIQRGPCSRTPAARSLENWLRKQARQDIQRCLASATTRLKRHPHRVYVMGQRTKWGNCSRKRNLSFNWRLIFAPPEVLRYIVTHEVAHLVEPYHSAKFWLLLRSHCPGCDSARRWLQKNQPRLYRPLVHVLYGLKPKEITTVDDAIK